MSNPVFPTLPSGSQLDSSKYTIDIEDPSMSTDMEGGYVVTRAKHTRRPRNTYTCGFTMLTAADFSTLDVFYRDVARGGSNIFDWTDPVEGFTYQVRFKGGFQWTYVGIGPSKRWNCTFKLEQA